MQYEQQIVETLNKKKNILSDKEKELLEKIKDFQTTAASSSQAVA